MQIGLKMEAGDCPTLNMNAMENYLLSQSLMGFTIFKNKHDIFYILQKAADLQAFVGSLSAGSEPWLGGRDVNNDDNVYWVGSGVYLPDSSSYWDNFEPDHSGVNNCVYMKKNTYKIYIYDCGVEDKYVCEMY